MTRLFYEQYVPADPLLAPVFADMSPDHPQRVAKWLGEVFGGPRSTARGMAATPGCFSSTLAGN
jgi:truncated hemoglobin YjbI